MNTKHLGSCLCEKVKFEVEGEFQSFFLCHCKFCQKDTGSAHAANLFSTNSKFTWLLGDSFVKTFTLPKTRHAKSFCSECGSALPIIQNAGKLLVVPAGSLDVPVDIKPNAHLFVGSKANWEEKLEELQGFDGFPD